ncbi:hypothetical protein A3G55_01230 [Candidatus Giovannonibacteria bacterium RIFCSPLOWO2_12_FULL_44_25]|uniref:Uncharacterized protein n=2 Tax=Candidatus Giovannoniibacteriota TaxID=1752738 RepID=A0A1F5W8Y2_9BACT|nr:MAG: hypothetical protein UW53_C0019G0013 [Candidatus Giovannonibacteria bacterium GW2011_GWA1_44_25]KKU29920.1 MAG: hypothetical protein UX43_C0003G0013 [Candidatus Giovannonibacteria bacterium GW2011_GWB1_46_20]OGF50566.1 MAG: hypothetical protein A2120_04035 [Candidatus Giovannonibacteria bacterium GWA2_45_15]OGF60316.1 MAG: hypothetical protein A2W40_04090 [Candidatus Giovannonibacteria bacterium RIFCSPHIGHO2_01_45_12]OGF60947.1 MAG: hypothetical protein A2656_01680 [Candidatus Giovannon
MEQEPKEHDEERALDWLLKENESKENEGKDIKIINPKEERAERKAARKKTKRLLDNFGQKELFKEKT